MDFSKIRSFKITPYSGFIWNLNFYRLDYPNEGLDYSVLPHFLGQEGGINDFKEIINNDGNRGLDLRISSNPEDQKAIIERFPFLFDRVINWHKEIIEKYTQVVLGNKFDLF